MTGHIFLLSCLLAICLPIILVQFPRFGSVKELRAEVGAETRSEVSRRSSSPPRKRLRWTFRSCPKSDASITSAESEQGQVDAEQVTQKEPRRRWDTNYSRTAFEADACADCGASLDGHASTGQEDIMRARAGEKPWDRPLRWKLPRTENRKSSGQRWHSVTDASPPHKTGRELEARGIATRLFPPDPEPVDVEIHNPSSQTSSIPPQPPCEHSKQRPTSSRQHGPTHSNRLNTSPSKQQPSPPYSPSAPLIPTNGDSLLSPLDGSPTRPSLNAQQDAPLKHITKLSGAPCKHLHHYTCLESGEPSSVKTEEPSSSTDCHHNHCACDGSHAAPAGMVEAPSNMPDSEKPESRPQGASPRPQIVQSGMIRAASKETAKGTADFPSKTDKYELPLWQILLIILGLIIFIFAFAILVAHCLAWFLVYKTEARLGEVRNGLLRGGEMKLCLCGRG